MKTSMVLDVGERRKMVLQLMPVVNWMVKHLIMLGNWPKKSRKIKIFQSYDFNNYQNRLFFVGLIICVLNYFVFTNYFYRSIISSTVGLNRFKAPQKMYGLTTISKAQPNACSKGKIFKIAFYSLSRNRLCYLPC